MGVMLSVRMQLAQMVTRHGLHVYLVSCEEAQPMQDLWLVGFVVTMCAPQLGHLKVAEAFGLRKLCMCEVSAVSIRHSSAALLNILVNGAV